MHPACVIVEDSFEHSYGNRTLLLEDVLLGAEIRRAEKRIYLEPSRVDACDEFLVFFGLVHKNVPAVKFVGIQIDRRDTLPLDEGFHFPPRLIIVEHAEGVFLPDPDRARRGDGGVSRRHGRQQQNERRDCDSKTDREGSAHPVIHSSSFGIISLNLLSS
jgi:hypothetical protein